MKVSILLPVYNAANTIQETLDSIFIQTYTDYEVIIINDGSIDNSEEIILKNNDSRIRYYSNPGNKGLIYTLNRGIDLCKGEYIVRIDADDLMLPTRIEKQVDYMDTHPQTVALGSAVWNFDGIHKDKLYTPPLDPKEMQSRILLGSPLPHPAAIIRKSILDTYNIRFNANYIHAEDYKFWRDLLQYGELANLKEPLIKYRLSPTQISSKHKKTQLAISAQLRREMITELLQKDGLNYPSSYSFSKILALSKLLPKTAQYSTLIFLLVMSLPKYSIKTLVRFIGSGIYLRKGFSFQYTGAVLLKIINPSRFPDFNLNQPR